MAKIFKCRFHGVDCDFGVRAETTQAVIEDIYPHAVAAHQCALTLQEFADRIWTEVQDEAQEDGPGSLEGGLETTEARAEAGASCRRVPRASGDQALKTC